MLPKLNHFLLVLLFNSAIVLAQTSEKDSLLAIAVQQNEPEKVKQLLQSGANPDTRIKNTLNPTVLMYASGFADGQAMNYLIDAGAELDAIDSNGDPAINWAAYYGHVKNMKALKSSGADLSIRSKHGDALDVAYRLWHADSVLDVFRGSPLDKKTPRNHQQLIDAIRSGDYKLLNRKLSTSALNKSDGLGRSLLHHAVRAQETDMVELLLKRGANADVLNRVGQSPLTIAARYGHLNIVNKLLAHGANPNAAGEEYGLSPMIGAAVGGNVEVIEALLSAGADVNRQDIINQASPLHWAIIYGNGKAARTLIDNGADYTLSCLAGTQTAYTLALAYGNVELKNHIEEKRTAQNELLGSWKLSKIEYMYADTTYTVSSAQGYLLVGDKRYCIMYNPSSQPRTVFTNLSEPTEKETVAAFRSIVFNTGSYALLKESVLLALPDLAKVPGFEGGQQYYSYQFSKDRLEFKLYDETYPDGKKPEWYGHLEILLTFEKEK